MCACCFSRKLRGRAGRHAMLVRSRRAQIHTPYAQHRWPQRARAAAGEGAGEGPRVYGRSHARGPRSLQRRRASSTCACMPLFVEVHLLHPLRHRPLNQILLSLEIRLRHGSALCLTGFHEPMERILALVRAQEPVCGDGRVRGRGNEEAAGQRGEPTGAPAPAAAGQAQRSSRCVRYAMLWPSATHRHPTHARTHALSLARTITRAPDACPRTRGTQARVRVLARAEATVARAHTRGAALTLRSGRTARSSRRIWTRTSMNRPSRTPSANCASLRRRCKR